MRLPCLSRAPPRRPRCTRQVRHLPARRVRDPRR